MKQNDKFYPLVRNIGIVITIPMVFAAGPILGFAIGWWVDEKWGFDPWGKTILSLLGFVASVKQVIDLIKKATKDVSSDVSEDTSNNA
ncbi:MAG: AtpZ/AtpI family protein [Candidatus Omnitrophica bacterium]|nr:AtpZ/AtpI family protein [Candidatus Omnitrophota bacterium]